MTGPVQFNRSLAYSLSVTFLVMIGLADQHADNATKKQQANRSSTPDLPFRQSCIDARDDLLDPHQFTLKAFCLRSDLLHIDTVKKPVVSISQVEQALLHLISGDSDTMQSFNAQFNITDYLFCLGNRILDFTGPTVIMATRTIIFVDKTYLGLQDGMSIVTNHTLGASIFNRLPMS